MAGVCCNSFWSTCSSVLRRTVQQQQHSSAELNVDSVDTKWTCRGESNLDGCGQRQDSLCFCNRQGQHSQTEKKTPLGTDGQRHMCSKGKCLKDLAGLASLGQLGYRHWECYGWSKGHVGVEEAGRRRTRRSLWFTWTVGTF